MEKPNRKLLLLDTWKKMLEYKPGIERHIRSITPIARRFVFDAEASAHIGQLLFDAGDLVAEQINFAKPPYEHTYIEISAREMFNNWRPINKRAVFPGDTELGLLYTGNRMYTFCANKSTGMDETLAMFYVDIGRGQATPLAELWGNHGLGGKYDRPENHYRWHDTVKLSYLLGGMRQPDGTIDIVRADYDYFLNNYNLGTPYEFGRMKGSMSMVDAAFKGGGDLLIGAAALLLIHGHKTNRVVHIDEVPHSRGIHKGKAITFKAHGVVSIKLGARDTIRRIVFGNRASPRLHDVMGTWVHYHRDRHCEHDWIRLEDPDHERYQCRKCPTLRSWRHAHVRGDASKGVRTKTYEVTE